MFRLLDLRPEGALYEVQNFTDVDFLKFRAFVIFRYLLALYLGYLLYAFMQMLYRNLFLGRKSCRQQSRREIFFWLKLGMIFVSSNLLDIHSF